MYNKLLDLIEEEKNVDVVKQLNIIKHKIDRGEPEDVSIREVYEYLCDEQTASLDKDYIKTVEASVKALKKLLDDVDNKEEEEEVVVEKEEEVVVEKEAEVVPVKDFDENKVKEKVKKEENIEPEEEHEEKHEEEHEEENEEEVKEHGNVNKVAVALKTCAIVEGGLGYLLGVIMGFSKTNSEQYFSFALMISYWLVTAIMILFTLGFAEVIQILHDIRKMEKNK
jgi:cation transport ATPase